MRRRVVSVRCYPAIGRHFGFDFLDGGFSFDAGDATSALTLAGTFVALALRRGRVVWRPTTGAAVVVRMVELGSTCGIYFVSRSITAE